MMIADPFKKLFDTYDEAFRELPSRSNENLKDDLAKIRSKFVELGYIIKNLKETDKQTVPRNYRPLSGILLSQQHPDYKDPTSTLVTHILGDRQLENLIRANGDYVFFNPEVSTPTKPEGEFLIFQPTGNELES